MRKLKPLKCYTQYTEHSANQTQNNNKIHIIVEQTKGKKT